MPRCHQCGIRLDEGEDLVCSACAEEAERESGGSPPRQRQTLAPGLLNRPATPRGRPTPQTTRRGSGKGRAST
jgi:hypothetical protein